MTQQINKMDASFRRVINHLAKNGLMVRQTIDLNKGRYKIIQTEQGINYLVLYKKDFFNSFSKYFPEEKGVGDTINSLELRQCINQIDHIIFTYKDGKIYSISKDDFMEHSHSRNIEFEDKESRCINIKFLERENPNE